ncbi:MAG TPA: exosortase H-associated membrane protein, partial [Rudaea sp.]|nr:exosortase H-associated membrane protein [Rudaea sp.]
VVYGVEGSVTWMPVERLVLMINAGYNDGRVTKPVPASHVPKGSPLPNAPRKTGGATISYALPLFAGLVLATPLTRWQRTRQIALGCVVIWIAQAFGVVAESLKAVGLDAGQPGAEALQRAGIPLDAVALAYQFGYLILPVLVPAVLWIVCNRPFIEELIRPVREPDGVQTVEHPLSGGN